jgi:hypothetical protein
MLKKLVLILAAVAVSSVAFATPPPPPIDPMLDSGLYAECECQRYGICSDPPPAPPPKPK